MRILTKLFCLLAYVISLAGCAGMGTDQTIGTLAGGGIGLAAGSLVGQGTGRTAAMVGGAAVGGLMGNSIGQSMDRTNDD